MAVGPRVVDDSVAPVVEATTVYEVMAAPLASGAVHDTSAEVFDVEPTLVIAGVPGAPRVGENGCDEVEGGEEPAAFMAVIDTVYCVPYSSPVMVQLVARAVELPLGVEQVAPPGLAVTV